MTAKETFKDLVGKYILVNAIDECVSIEQEFPSECETIEQALNELEFYKSFPQIQEASLIPEVNLKLVTCELNLRELQRDVARYFELQYKNQFERMTQNEIHEMYVLREKLMKVGK